MIDETRAIYAAGCGLLAGVGMNAADLAVDLVSGGVITHIITGVGVACFVYGRSPSLTLERSTLATYSEKPPASPPILSRVKQGHTGPAGAS